jgi:prenyltransferase beta subunit
MGRLLPPSSEHEERLTTEELAGILAWCLKRYGPLLFPKLPPPSSPSPLRQAELGFNGRCNKECDSCYSFWIGASIDLLSSFHLTDSSLMRSALLTHYQNTVTGGFSKLPGYPPDIIHSFYSTAALSIATEEGTKRMNSAYCLRVDRMLVTGDHTGTKE